MHPSSHIKATVSNARSCPLSKRTWCAHIRLRARTPGVATERRRSPCTLSSPKDLGPISLNQQKRIAIIGAQTETDELTPEPLNAVSSTDEDTGPKRLSTTEPAGALPVPGTSTATAGAGTGLAEALNLTGGGSSSSSSSSSPAESVAAVAAAAAAAAADLPSDEATDPELASWVEQLQQESLALATQLSQYRHQAAAKISSLAGRPALDADARQELEELTAVLQAALAQVDVLSRQAALAEVLQHRIIDQEDVLQQLQVELEHVDAQRAAEYETTLANITELEEALALAQEQVDASHRLEEMLELKDALQQQLSEARNELSQAEAQLADSRKESEALAAKLKTAEEAKAEAEKARSAAETARKEAEETLETLKADFGSLQAEVKKAQEAADQVAAAAATSTGPAQQQQQLSKKAKRKAKKSAKGFGKIDAGEESGDEGDFEPSAVPDLSNMVNLLKQKDADVAAAKIKLDEATKNLTDAEQKLKASEGEVTKLTAQLETQKKELEAAAAKKLEEAEATFTKQLAEMQTLLSDYQTQVIDLSKQNNQLEEEALALEQRLGEALGKVEKGEKRLAELSAQVASGVDGSKELTESIKTKEAEVSEAKLEVSELKDELKSAVKREASKALELSRAQQDLLLAEKASTKLQTERDDLAKKVVALRSSQLKAEQALADAAAAEAKLAEAAQQIGSVSAQLSTETARAQKLAGEIGAAKDAEKTALAKLAAAQAALEDQQKLASQRGGQVQHLSNQIESLKTTMKNMTKDKEALQALTTQINERDTKIQTAQSQLEAARSENNKLSAQLDKLRQQLQAASTAAPTGALKEELKKAQLRATQLAEQTAQLQAQLRRKDADIAVLADKLEAAVAAAAEAAEQSQTTAAAAAVARGAAGLNEETRKALAVAQQQVEEAVRARLGIEKEVSLLRASNENYSQQVEALTLQISQLENNIVEATEQSTIAAQQLQQVKALALAETESAAAILGKAERLIKTLAEQRQQQQQRDRQAAAAAAAAGNQQEVALRAQMADLQVKLAEQSDIAAESSSRAQELEEDLVALKAEVAQMRRTAAIGGSSFPLHQLSAEVAERETALAEKLAAAEARSAAAAAEREAIKQRVLQLETELRQRDKAVEEAVKAAAAGGRDKQVSTLMARVSSLEAQNSQLRVAAAKREQVLQQSRKFIESHLSRWAPGTAPPAAAAATAAAPAANGVAGREGPTGNGINPN